MSFPVGRARIPLALTAILALLASCTLINSLDSYTRGVADGGAAADSAPVETDAGDASTCVSALPPGPPAATADETGPDLVFGVSRYLLDEEYGAALPPDQRGYNLDKLCTGAVGPSECVTTPGANIQDLAGGVDNQYAKILAEFAKGYGSASAFGNTELAYALNSLVNYSHPRLFGGIGTLSSLASPQICPIFSVRPPRDRTDCAQKSFGANSSPGC